MTRLLRPPWRWVPTDPDGRRWELWRGKRYVGRVWVRGESDDHWPGPPVDALCVSASGRVEQVVRVDLGFASDWLLERAEAEA